ncbi:hypothetical protein ANN_27629 [Periplaneta americana]|uniref:Uncharacterized protein n=1 Tax=Periplaneta americana TaxID=6978 RepID=A0ABQ8RWJ7_PERAM|nr:hypothetical protein ANN_27629 [Periplaneta americana]
MIKTEPGIDPLAIEGDDTDLEAKQSWSEFKCVGVFKNRLEMDVIKTEPEVDPLAIEPSDDAVREEAPDEETTVESTNSISGFKWEIKFEEVEVPSLVIKSEPEDAQQDEVAQNAKPAVGEEAPERVRKRRTPVPLPAEESRKHPRHMPEIKIPRKSAVAKFRLLTEHDYLAKYLHKIGIYRNPNCPLCNKEEEMTEDHLITCEVLPNGSTTEKCWRASTLMASLPKPSIG